MGNNLLYFVKDYKLQDNNKLHKLDENNKYAVVNDFFQNNYIPIPLMIFLEMVKETLERYEKNKFSVVYEKLHLKSSMLGSDLYEYINSVYFIPTNSNLTLELKYILDKRYKVLNLDNEKDIIVFNLEKPFLLSDCKITSLEYLPQKYNYLIKELNRKVTILEDA